MGSQISGIMPKPPGIKRVSNCSSSLTTVAKERLVKMPIPFFDGGFQAARSGQIVDVDQLESVVVTARDDSAQRTKEI